MVPRDPPRADSPIDEPLLPVPQRDYRKLFAYVVVSIGLVAVALVAELTFASFTFAFGRAATEALCSEGDATNH